MKSLSSTLDKYKINVSAEKSTTVGWWQEYAIAVCKEFGIKRPYDAIIFRYAKQNLQLLEKNVGMARETAAMRRQPTSSLGRYLVSLFRKTKPWENKQ